MSGWLGDERAGNRFVIAGISLASLKRQLKPALPKKREESSCRVVITARENRVTFAITGAAVDIPAVTSGLFVAEVPYAQFKATLAARYEPGAMVVFDLADGRFSVNSVTVSSWDIRCRRADEADEPPAGAGPSAQPAIPDPSEACIGLPLITAYKHIRAYGMQPTASSPEFRAQQLEVDHMLTRAVATLKPLGVTRTELERLLDRKLGVARADS